jgi:hypothetical protein
MSGTNPRADGFATAASSRRSENESKPMMGVNFRPRWDGTPPISESFETYAPTWGSSSRGSGLNDAGRGAPGDARTVLGGFVDGFLGGVDDGGFVGVDGVGGQDASRAAVVSICVSAPSN